jgi:hypothetical protein
MTLGVSFSASGHLACYHLGVARALRAHPRAPAVRAWAGTSGGAVAASSARDVADLDALAEYAVTRRLLTGYRALLPEDAHRPGAASLHVAVTASPSAAGRLLSHAEFPTRAALLSCVAASCWVRAGAALRRWLGLPPAPGDTKALPHLAGAFYDGAFADACPTPAHAATEWITVSPFAGPRSATHICPEDRSPRLGTWRAPGGLRVYASLANLVRLAAVWWWPEAWLRAACRRGEADARAFLDGA